MVPSVQDLLPRVRQWVLTQAMKGDLHFGLSYAVMSFAPTRKHEKTYRGKVQACLSILAREGIMFGRNHPEHYVAPYEHGETDKRFHIRIQPMEALNRLAHG